MFSTKARTLSFLKKEIKCARIEEIFTVRYADWEKRRNSIIKEMRLNLRPTQTYIARSSSVSEDLFSQSNAGAFLSIPNQNLEDLDKSIDKVFKSYGKTDKNDEVLIQPMLKGVIRSGVLFSHDPNTCSPYRIVNWSEGESTTQITGGGNGKVWQQAALMHNKEKNQPVFIQRLIDLCEEILILFDQQPLDLEFAFTTSIENHGHEDLWLLQARPLILREESESNDKQAKRLQVIEAQIERGLKKHPYLMGNKTVYGVMPDWNPAEIVGIRPKPLALSLYREMVTDSIWAYQRHNYGYRNLRSFPLMPHFFGIPYIDVRLSFNSFIPASLDSKLASRLVDYYIDKLLEEPTLHDKVEFEIVFSCYTLDLKERLLKLEDKGFTKNECNAIRTSLRNLTNKIIHPREGLWKIDIEKINTLNRRRDELMNSNLDLTEKIYWLLEDGKRYGTLPFAGLARAGFIAVQMLKSFINIGLFSEKDYQAFIGSLTTVSKRLSNDRITLDKSEFLAKYGHLRPGTYDITSKRYDEAPDFYFDWQCNKHKTKTTSNEFTMTIQQVRRISNELKSHSLFTDPVGLFDFLQAGIEQRENAKFHFTRNLSDALDLICQLGETYNISREDLAFSDISIFKELHVSASNHEDLLKQSIEVGKQHYAETCKLSLPPLISSSKDIWGFEWPNTDPNFITHNEIRASIALHTDINNLNGSIVCIPNADPGYDWLFSHDIGGLITAWGGANSHMAIRAGELNIPAVIGCGEVLFKQWSECQKLYINCSSKIVTVIQ